MRNSEYGDFWQPTDFHTQHARMDLPMLHVAGWYDTFLQGTIDSYTGLRAHARTRAAKQAQKLIVGPWQHVSWGRSTVGDLDFGEDLLKLNPFPVRRRWFDHWLRGLDDGLMGEPPVLIFVMVKTSGAPSQSGPWPAPAASASTCTRMAA